MHRPLLLILALSAAAAAQGTQIPLPNYTSTWSSANATRGLFFQAPVAFVIVGLRVPDEQNNGTQCVEVRRMTAAPPLYSATANEPQVFYANNVPSTQIIPCSIPFAAGEWVGVLGACGTTTMLNSYAPNNFASNVLGAPVTLQRFLTQTNLHTTGGGQPYSTENGGSLARVEIYVTPATGYAAWSSYGTGCGTPPLQLTLSARPILGSNFNLTTGNIPAGTQIGASLLSFAQFLPGIPLDSLGMPGCLQHLSPDVSLVFLVPGATANQALALPNLPAFAGSHLFSQSLTFSPVNAMGAITSNGVDLLLDVR